MQSIEIEFRNEVCNVTNIAMSCRIKTHSQFSKRYIYTKGVEVEFDVEVEAAVEER